MKTLLLTVAVAALAAFPGHATAQENNSAEKYAAVTDIPEPLVQRLAQGWQRGTYIERYIATVLEPLRSIADDKINLGADDIKRMIETKESERRRQSLQNVIRNDRNYDGIVTRDEVAETYKEQRRAQGMYAEFSDFQKEFERQYSRHLDKIMELDTDKDGSITLTEMAVVQESRQDMIDRETAPYEELLTLDPNNDGKLTATELDMLARKAFNTVDTDNNGILSKEESQVIYLAAQEAERRQRSAREAARIREKCAVPTPGANDQIIAAGVYEGDTASNISIADQTETTDIVTVTVEPGKRKIHFTASAFKPVIWQFSGATDRIAHVIVAGPSLNPGTDNNDSGQGPVNAGVVGIDKDRITFIRARDCGMLGLYEPLNKRGQGVKETLIALLGREPDHTGGTYSPLGMRIGGADGIVPVIAERKDMDNHPSAPAKYDAEAWKNFVRFQPGGLADIKAADVVSEAPVIAYEVMPGWAGIAQLVGEGALMPLTGKYTSVEILNDHGGSIVIQGMEGDDTVVGAGAAMRRLNRPEGFRVVKDIPYFPTGLYGAHSTTFVMSEGVKMPANKAGHSQIITEAEYRAGKGLRHGD